MANELPADRPDRPDVFVVVGTDHHRFDRLIGWIDQWAQRRPDVTVLVQRGTAAAPQHASSVELLPYERVQQHMADAAVVVSHGGPGTIMDCRAAGTLPIVVPRTRALGEHVDDHQVVFARATAAAGVILLAETAEELERLLDAALADPAMLSVTTPARGSQGVARTAELIGALGPRPRRGGAIRRTRGRIRAMTTGRRDPIHQQVLYIAGWGRSGSTLLDRMIGQLDGVVSVGEMRDIWERGVVEDRRCGCGEAFSGCDFWRQVGDKAFGGWDQLDLERVRELRRTVDRPWYVLFLLAPWLSRSYRLRLAEYADLLRPLYDAVGSVSGARVIVDSSKITTYGMILRRAGMRPRALHLIRDSRGVIFSWQKSVERPDSTGRADSMLKYGVVSGSVRYLVYNVMAHLLPLMRVPYRRVRYEDLIVDPWNRLNVVARHAGLTMAPALQAPLERGEVALRPNHTVDGNPMRFQVGTVTLRVDDAWQRSLAPTKRKIITVLTAPLLAAYGYRLQPTKRRSEQS